MQVSINLPKDHDTVLMENRPIQVYKNENHS